ncbi:DHA2 family efflux MFS transporter permease subunit [Cellulomonas triticagri]|uniref:DHA2 family efflux MFS transporter permease subunit n=1 Tax=Cellulomonas triticagri TaxID=2483352 RepID=A0A3M2JN83_9CELL|nr:DHA2 family efflux MFS transporter permease subunit [Cellulomonas triticagri]RMI13053.1 DHA2 family efflux MFS transporter permease subunit [Cellulomonas triticagri]
MPVPDREGGPTAAPASLTFGTAAGRGTLLATVLGSALVFLDGTVVGIALPAIAADLGATSAGLQWTVNGYALTLAALLLLGGSLGDRFGRRRLFLIGTIAFAAASVLCAVAPTVGLLVAARAVQGVGGALLTPGSLAILQSSFAERDRARAIGAWSGLAGAVGAVAPFLGGWIVEHAGWRWVFGINIPLAALVVVVAVRWVPESVDAEAPGGLDVVGTALAALGLGALTWALTAWSEAGSLDATTAAVGAGGVLALVAFLVAEAKQRYPALPLALFRWRPFAAVNLATLLVYAALSGVFFFLPITLQVVTGWSPLAAGIASLPVTLLMLALSAQGGALGARIGPRIPMTVGPLLAGGGAALLAGIGPGTTYVTGVLPGVLLVGAGLVLTVAPLTSTALSAAPDHLAGVASATNNAVSRVAGLLAVAVLPLVAGVGAGLSDPAVLADAHPVAMLACAVLMAGGALVSAVAIPTTAAGVRPPAAPRT